MFYDKRYFRFVLDSTALDDCKSVRDAFRKGFELYFKHINALQNIEVYNLKQFRFVQVRGGSDLQFNLSFKGKFKYAVSVDVEQKVFSSYDVPLSDKVVEDVNQGHYVDLVQLVLNDFSDSVLGYQNLVILNDLLKGFKPQGSPYLVQFCLNERTKDRFVSTLREDLLEWCVVSDYLQSLSSVFPSDGSSLKEFIRKEFYVGFDVLTEALRGQKVSWAEYLAGRPPTGVTYNPLRLLGALALELDWNTDKRCKFLYLINDDDIVTLYQRDDNSYHETLRFHKETGELSDISSEYVLVFNTETHSLEKVIGNLDESA